MVAVQETLKYFLLRAFDIREGEYWKALLMQAYVFLLISTLLVIKPTVYALFLSKFGANNLPWAFLAVALFAIVVSFFYTRSLSRFPLLRVNIATLFISVLVLIGAGILLRTDIWVYGVTFLFYIWVSLFGVLVSSQFWILASMVFNPREAKRLFGFIGAGAIAGGIFGGYLTSLLTQFVSGEILLFVAAGMLGICIPIVIALGKKVITKIPAPVRTKRKSQHTTQHPLRLIRSSRHLTYLASIIGLSVIVAKLVDYQFSAFAAARIPDPDELAAFFGFWFSTLNLISLFIQLFLTRRIVGVWGVGTSLFFLPLGICVGAVLMLLIPELWVAIFIKIADGSLKQSVNKAAVELLALPIPQDIKSKTKTFIDVMVDSLATGIGGILLIFLVSGLELSPALISLLILLMLGLWIFFVWKIRGEYLRSFQETIGKKKGKKPGEEIDLTQTSVLGGISRSLANGSDKQLLFLLKRIRGNQYSQLFEPIRNLLIHPNPEVRAAAIRSLYFYVKTPEDNIYKMVSDPEEQVSIAAFEYMIHMHPPSEVPQLMEAYLTDSNYRVRTTAFVSLCSESGRNLDLQEAFSLEKVMYQLVDEIKQTIDPDQVAWTKTHLLQGLCKAPMPQMALFIKEALKDPDSEIQHHALLAAASSLQPVWIEDILPFLEVENMQKTAIHALSLYDIRFYTHLPPSLFKAEKEVATLRKIPSVLEILGNQQSILYLFELLEHEDLGVQLASLKALNTLKKNFPYLRFDEKEVISRILDEARLYRESLSVMYVQRNLSGGKEPVKQARESLIALLERRLDGRLERIFRLLGLKYPPDDMISVYQRIQQGDLEKRIMSVEFLDNLLESRLKSMLIPIVETAMMDVVSEKTIRKLNMDIPDERKCCELLLHRRDIRLKMAVFYLIIQLRDPQYISLIAPYLEDKSPRVRDFAQQAYSAITPA